MNMKKIISSQMDQLGWSKFKNLASDIEKDLEPEVEKQIRKMVASSFGRVCRQARNNTKPQTKKESNHETQ
jgi:hypothetical protein